MSFFIYHRKNLERKNFCISTTAVNLEERRKKIGACFGYHVSRLSQIVTDKKRFQFCPALFWLSKSHTLDRRECYRSTLRNVKETQNVSHGTDNFTIPQPPRQAGMSDNGKMSFCGLGAISEKKVFFF